MPTVYLNADLYKIQHILKIEGGIERLVYISSRRHQLTVVLHCDRERYIGRTSENGGGCRAQSISL